MWKAIEARLVDDWRKVLTWWSVRWAIVGGILLPLIEAAPQALPPEIAALLPPSVRAIAPGIWCIGFIAFRAWQQKHPNGQ